MKLNKYIITLITFFILLENAFSKEINFQSSNIKILEEGNVINSINSEVDIPEDDVKIMGDEAYYNKTTQKLIIKKNVIYKDNTQNIIIESDEIIYDIKEEKIYSYGNSKVFLENKYEIISTDIIFDKINKEIFAKNETTVYDDKNNILSFQDNFNFKIEEEIINSDLASIIDNQNNNYVFEKTKINLKTNEILGKEINIDFRDSFFGNPKNDPKLKGRTVISNENETLISKAVFSTCNTENKKCPGWEIQTEEFKHDKNKKIFEYKNSWLKVFDKRVFYFPYFNHPDPTVKRKSGFLTPSYGSSNNMGNWFNIPYFKTLGINKDVTFKPRFYTDDKIILQSEYRQAFENYNFISDFSLNNDGKNNNTHLFAKIDKNNNNGSSLSFKYQDVSNDNYLKLNNLSSTSALIENESLLTSELNINKTIDQNTSFKSDFIVYEDLSKKDSDKFQYVLPNFTFEKNILLDKSYNGNFTFSSNGFQKNYNTNVKESLFINDFLFESNDSIFDSGLKNKYNFLLKNFNSYSENSSKYLSKEDYDVYGTLMTETSLPMKKISENSINYLKPIISLRYSPNDTKNISNNDVRLTYDNIFTLNRIGNNELVEGGKSISLGIEYEKFDLNNKNIFSLNLANTIRDKKNHNLPTKTKLNQKMSDIVGKISYSGLDNLSIAYNFSLDNNLRTSNYDSLYTELIIKNFSTNLNFLSENNEIGGKEVLMNSSKFDFNDEKSLSFNVSKNLKNDFTEYYNLIYEYKTDCMVAALEYKKDFYRDDALVPSKNLFLTFKFIPFADVTSTSLN